MRVAVIGGGVVGATTALELGRREAEVTLFEADELASKSTGRAAGVCYDAFADPVDADIARRALSVFHERDALVDCPYVWLARDGDDRSVAAIDEGVSRMQRNDLDVERVDPDVLGERYPALCVDDVERAAVSKGAGYVETTAYTRETAALAVDAGVAVRERTPVSVEDDRTVDDEAYDAVVVAAGAHTARLLGDAGFRVPVKPYRVQAFCSEPTPLSGRVPMLYDATGGYYIRPRDGGLFVGDGTEPVERDPDKYERDADDWFVDDCATYLKTAIGETVPERRSWAGLCTATPDGDPLVGERAPGVYVATGFQGHGFMRAPALGERLAEQVCGGGGVDAFDPKRFDGDEAFEIVEGMALDD